MKSFFKNNWYKIIMSTSFFIFSIGFLLHALAPSYANENNNKLELSPNILQEYPNAYAVADGGYIYIFGNQESMFEWGAKGSSWLSPMKCKLP
jgi:hypothetical protein